MAYTNSPLVVHTKLSPNHSGQRTHSIDRISPHCVVGQCTAESLGSLFADPDRQASSNYGIDRDGRVGMYVEEKNRSWCTSSRENDQRAITIECASDTTAPYAMKDVVYDTLIMLCADICKRNGKTKLLWFGDKDKSLAYAPADNEMLITVHRWFANKSCPGDWLYSRLDDLAAKVTALLTDSKPTTETVPTEDAGSSILECLYPERLSSGYYRVRKSWADTRSQLGAYRLLSNAKKKADGNPGYFVFTEEGTAIYPVVSEPEKAPIREETNVVHTVVPGDTLWKISERYLGKGIRYKEIKALNGLTSDTIYRGMKLKIPK